MLLSNARFVGVVLFVPQINFEKLATMQVSCFLPPIHTHVQEEQESGRLQVLSLLTRAEELVTTLKVFLLLYGDEIPLHAPNSSLEGAMKLTFVPFCSSRGALSDGILLCRFSVSGRKPWTIVRRFDRFFAHP